MSEEVSFTYIQPGFFTKEDLVDIAEALKWDISHTSLEDTATMLNMRTAIAWRFKGGEGERGILVTQILSAPHTKVLFVWLLAGSGMIKHAKYIDECVVKLARQNSCLQIRALARPGLAKLYKRKLGYEAPMVCVTKEVS